MSPLQSQVLGLTLALATAVGCIAYERLVKNFSLFSIIFVSCCFYVPTLIVLAMLNWHQTSAEVSRLFKEPQFRWWAFVYWITWITTPIWYVITRKQSVMVGGVYEIKYIVMLAVIYLFLGDRQMNLNTALGLLFALVSVYFISRG